MEKFGEEFESDVTSDGTQTGFLQLLLLLWFESDVTSDGTQTQIFRFKLGI